MTRRPSGSARNGPVFYTHPGRAIYHEIARDIAAQVTALAPVTSAR